MKKPSQYKTLGKLLSLTAAVVVSATCTPAVRADCTPAPAGVVGWWPGEGNANDVISGNGGIVSADAAFAPALVGQGFQLGDSNAFVRIPASASLNIGTNGTGMTLETWIYATNVYGFHPIFEWNPGIPGAGLGVHMWLGAQPNDNGVLMANLVDAGGASHGISSAQNSVTASQYQHVAMTYDPASGNQVLYVNGAVVAQQNIGQVTPQTSYDLYFGKRANDVPGDSTFGSYFGGIIDEPSIYKRALASNEVAAIYNAGSAGKCSPSTTPATGVPAIKNVFPISGPSGSVVIISGANFNPTAGSNIVFFGAVQANVTAATTTNLTVTVPVSATYAPITVTVGGLTARANLSFLPTFTGNGSGIVLSNFGPSFTLPTPNGPAQTAIADLDGDGKPDLIVIDAYNNVVSIYRNISTNGTLTAGSFAPRVDLPTTSGTYSPSMLAVADVDGDGKLDIIVAEYGDNAVSVFQNNCTPGNISTSTFANRVEFQAGAQCQAVAVADLDGDGKPEILAANITDGTISILYNTSTVGSLTTNSFAPKVDFLMGSGCSRVAVCDLNGDGKPDVVGVNNDGTLAIRQNLISAPGRITTNSLAAPIYLSIPTGGVSVTVVDLDGDGNPDLAVTSYLPQTLSIFRNLGAGGNLTANSFAPRVDYGLDGRGHTIAVGDLDGDGKPDLVVDTELSSLVSLFDNLSTPGSFTNSSLAPQVELATGWNAWGISVGDLDGDGRPDLVFGNSYDGNIQIYQNFTPFGTPSAPVITAQPTNVNATVNDTVVLNVTATGTQPLYFQWSLNGAQIPGANAPTLIVTNVQLAQGGLYSVLVSNYLGSVTSSNAFLSVYFPPTPPSILSQTPSQMVALGSPATFNVTSAGYFLNYFWSRNGTLIPNATNSSYVLASAQLSDSGSVFSCLVTNAFGTASSTNVTLKVLDVVPNSFCTGAILITNAAYTNQQSTLKAGVPGNPVPDCVSGFGHGVWYEFTAPVAGLLVVDTFGSDYDTGLALYTGTCDALTEVACNDDFNGPTSQVTLATTPGTTYMILAGGFESDAGNLTLHLNYFTPPAFVVPPTNLAVVVSSNAIFSATVSGSLPMGFQWYFNNTPLVDGGRISGSTNLQLAIANVQPNDGGNYQIVASNFMGVTTSSVAVLTPVILPPTIVQAPLSQSVGQGSNVTFTAVVGGTPPFNYQWSFNGSPLVDDGIHIAGSATSTLTISNLTSADNGAYYLTITNVSGTAVTSATLTVMVPPLITQQPMGRSVPPGLPTVFTAAASGLPVASYQWQLNGTNIPGATSANYTNAAVGTNTLGYYQLVASNLMGVATSSPALLTFGPVAAWGRNLNNECLPPPGLSNVIAVAGNFGASFAIQASGKVVVWGGGAYTNLPVGATNVVAMTSDNYGNYALRADGTVVGWGYAIRPGLSNIVALSGLASSYGYGLALRAEGTVTNFYNTTPAYGFASGLNHVTAIAAGYNFALALRTNGTLALASYNIDSQVTNVPPSVTNVIAIAAGHDYAMALKADGTVVAWGSGSATNLPPGMTNIVSIAAGNYYENSGLATRSDGVVFAWGDNNYGETNTPFGLSSWVVSGLSASAYHRLALVNNGSPQIVQPPIGQTAYVGRDVALSATVAGAAPLNYQWLLNGTNVPGATNASLFLPAIQPASAGQYQLFVSNAISTALSLPAPVNVISNNTLLFLSQNSGGLTNNQASKISLDGFAVLGNGPLRYQWFFAPSGPTIKGDLLYTSLPGATNDTLTLDPALAVQSGYYYLAVSNQFSGITSTPVNIQVLFAKAWGYLATNAPFNLTNATAIAVGNYGSSLISQGDYLALSSAGKIFSWAGGSVQYGETNFSALSNSIITAIAAGYGDTLALNSEGTVFALGGYYSLSGPTLALSNIPPTAVGITAIACGDYHDLALRWDGTVVGWGQNTYGQATNSVTNAVAIAAGGNDSIALHADGTVVTWGNYGVFPYLTYPIPASLTNAVAVAAGGSHFLALRANGTVVGWGSGTSGQTAIPASWTNIVAIAAGNTHSTALRNDGTVLAIGSFGGTLPGYVATNYITPDLSNVVAIAASGNHNLALFGTRAPAFTVQPWNRTVFNTTTSVWFSAKCAGVQPMSYQWQFNGTNVPGATNDLLTINASNSPSVGAPSVTYPLQSGFYRLVASNAYGVVASKYAQLAVIIPLATAVNASNQVWTTAGSVPWFGETNVTHDGVAAAQSGNVGILQDSILQTTVATNVAGNYTFWWNVSSEPDLDYLEFRINGIVQTSISGQTGWQQVSIPVAAGTNVLLWRYSEQSIYSSGQNAGWLDQFAFIPTPVILAQPASISKYAGSTATFSIVVSNPLQQILRYQWQKNGVNLVNGGKISGATSPALMLNNIQDADAAGYSVSVTNTTTGGSITSSVAILTVLDSIPVITSQTGGLTNLAGTTATLSVTATGTVPMYFQWWKNGLSLPTGISSTLTLSNVQDADAASYAVIITNASGSVTSAPIQLTIIDQAPVLTSQPANAWLLKGGSTAFAVSATGTTPMYYQWQFNGTNLNQATNASLLLTNVSNANVGAYQVIVTNSSGAITSSVATLLLTRTWLVAWGDNTYGQTNVPSNLPDISAISAGFQHNLVLCTNGSVAAWGRGDAGETNVPAGLAGVTAVAAGDDWNMVLTTNHTVTGWGADGVNLQLTNLLNVTAIAAGWFQWVAVKSDGSLATYDLSGDTTNIPSGISNVTAVAAGIEFSLALQAGGTIVAWGLNNFGETNLPPGLSNVTAIAASPGSYHSLALKNDGTVVAWGNDSNGQTDIPSGLSNVVAIAAGAEHSMALKSNGTVVSWGANGKEDTSYGQAIVPAGLSNVVAISAGGYHSLALVNDGSPWIVTQPLGQTVASNTTVRFAVTALGAPTLAYQWQKNGVNLSDGGNVAGSATATLTLSNVQTTDMAVYSVQITNAIDQLASAPATLLVVGPPQITQQPVSQTVSGGAPVQFSVTALGSPAPAYQWVWNGTNLAGGSAILTLTNATRAQEGTYSVLVTNGVGGVFSSNVVLRVLVPQQLGKPTLLPNGTLQFTSSDVGGGALPPADLSGFEAQASSNLLTWVTLPNALILSNGTLVLQDSARTNNPSRFYRIVEH